MTENVPGELHLVIRTPQQTIFDDMARAARVPTETGQVGLRPRGESVVLVIESGLVTIRQAGGTRFAATAGGLLEGDRHQCVLYTPFAVVDSSEVRVLAALEQALATPDSELAARRKLGELERHIVNELRDRTQTDKSTGSRHG